MKRYAHVIVEQVHGHWSASFAGTPQVAYGGEWPSQAIERLLEATDVEVEPQQILTIDDATCDDYMEFWIPYRNWRRIPKPSLN